jgi:hypothetical protein
MQNDILSLDVSLWLFRTKTEFKILTPLLNDLLSSLLQNLFNLLIQTLQIIINVWVLIKDEVIDDRLKSLEISFNLIFIV